MAATFWASNHRAGLIPEEEVRGGRGFLSALLRGKRNEGQLSLFLQLDQVPASILITGVTALEIQQLKEFYCTRIFTMVAVLEKARLRVATTACTYFYRFFNKYTFKDHDPRHIVPACIYLSGTLFEDDDVNSVYACD